MFPGYQALIEQPSAPPRVQAEGLLNPIGVGAVGGSGTRLVRSMLAQAGIAMSAPINEAGDSIEWPPITKLLDGRGERSPEDMLMASFCVFEDLLLRRRDKLGLHGRIGWKVPGMFLWLRELAAYFPQMQYIHLVRSGLDMAYSSNQTQVTNWASRFGIELRRTDAGRIHPSVVLEYWLQANHFALDLGRELLGDRFLVIRFEDLCGEPAAEVDRLFDFLGLDLPAAARRAIADLVRPPKSIGRYRERDWSADFSAEQLQRVEALGYRAGD